MLSLVSLGRGLWQKFQSGHAVIRWGGAILVGLVVLEFIGDEAINLYIKMQTARATIEQANELAKKTAAESCNAIMTTISAFGGYQDSKQWKDCADAGYVSKPSIPQPVERVEQLTAKPHGPCYAELLRGKMDFAVPEERAKKVAKILAIARECTDVPNGPCYADLVQDALLRKAPLDVAKAISKKQAIEYECTDVPTP